MNRNMSFAIVLLIISGISAGAQDTPVQPVPDHAPNNALVTGPISDAIERRLTERFEQMQEQRFAGILDEMRVAREERKGILESIMEIRSERNGLIARLSEMRDSFETWRTENQAQRQEWLGIVGRWTPLQNLVERLTGLVWKLFGFVIALCCLVFLLAVLAAVLWRKVNSLPSTIANAVVKS